MNIECIPDGLVQSNVYIIWGSGNEAVVIDCGCKPETILAVLNKKSLCVKHVILTHGHFDHIYYVDALREKTNATVYIHEQDARCLSDPQYSGLALFRAENDISFNPADYLLHDGDVLECGDLKLRIIHTPGHTTGGVCVHAENALFTGDTLFKSSIGRTDFPGGSMADLLKSIQYKLFTLPEETIVYPGHGVPTTIGYEKMNNPFLRGQEIR